MGRLSSMTGFGSARGSEDWGAWSVEVKSVNGRSLDVRVSLPSGFEAVERHAKAAASKRFKRGNLQLSVRLDPADTSGNLKLNTALLDQLTEDIAARGGTIDAHALATLMTIRGVVEADTTQLQSLSEQPGAVEALKGGIDTALGQMQGMRTEEGAALRTLLNGFLADMRSESEKAAGIAQTLPEVLKSRLQSQLSEIGADDQVDPDRLAAEVALSITKADIREELDRLSAHIDQAESLLSSGSPVGRKLEFLHQEMGREINTLCSKSTSLDLTNCGLALKALNDQFKEQAANVE